MSRLAGEGARRNRRGKLYFHGCQRVWTYVLSLKAETSQTLQGIYFFFFKSLNSQIKSQYGVEIIGKILFPGSRGNVSRDTLCQLLSAAAILRGPQVPGYSSPGWEGTDCKSS